MLLAISVVCALAAAVVMHAYARRLDATRPDGGPPVSLVATLERVTKGEVLTEEMLELVTMPSRFAPPGAVRDIARATGRVAVADLAAAEIVTGLRLAGTGAGPTASLVPPGMRAVQVSVPGSVDVEPGDLVDVIATFGGGGAHTEVTGEAIEVLAVDRASGGGSFGTSGAPTSGGGAGLVLLVTPTDAERLAFASAFATLSIAVRGPDDFLPGESFTVPVSADG